MVESRVPGSQAISCPAFHVPADCRRRVAKTIVLVPVRYPLKAPNVATLRRAADLAAQCDEIHLYILHVNLLYNDEDVSRMDLQRAIEQAVGPLPNASYHVRDAFLLEEAILNEACYQNADYVVIGRSLRSRWHQLLATRLGMTVDLETFLKQHLDGNLVVVSQ